jgi:hypothetical protein
MQQVLYYCGMVFTALLVEEEEEGSKNNGKQMPQVLDCIIFLAWSKECPTYVSFM